MIGFKLIMRFLVLAVSPSLLKKDPDRFPKSYITLAMHKIDGGKTRTFAILSNSNKSRATYSKVNNCILLKYIHI